MTSVLLGGTLIRKLPSASEAVPVLFDLTTMETPGNGSPDIPVIFPRTVTVGTWACSMAAYRKRMQTQRNFFIMAVYAVENHCFDPTATTHFLACANFAKTAIYSTILA